MLTLTTGEMWINEYQTLQHVKQINHCSPVERNKWDLEEGWMLLANTSERAEVLILWTSRKSGGEKMASSKPHMESTLILLTVLVKQCV